MFPKKNLSCYIEIYIFILRNALQSTNDAQFGYVDENLSSSFFINSLPTEYKQGDSMSVKQNNINRVNFLTLPQVTYLFLHFQL